MATTNISLNPFGWTYTNANTPNTNYANQSPLLAYGNLSDFGECKTILQFDVNSEVSASKINSAVLNLGIRIATGAGNGSDGKLYYSSAFTYGYIYNSVTHNNYSSMITQGVRTLKSIVSFSSSSFISNQFDVTSAVANNINDGVLTLVIEGYNAWPLQVDPNSISLVLNYEKPAEVEPVSPLITAPNGTYENRQNPIKFEWIYKSQTQATQASATLEYRKGTTGNYTTINVYNSNNYYTMPANTLNTGLYEWRVKTTDSDGKTSEYSTGSFTVIDKPSIPIITSVDNKCISTITWSSADQVAFEMEVYKDNVLEYNKKVSSSDNNHKPNIFFANTTYSIRLRVCNVYGMWSEWGNKIFTFTFKNPSKPTILVTQSNTDIIIKSDTVSSILYKSNDDGISYKPIFKFDDNKEFKDYKVSSNKIYKYFVRKYEDGYADSKIQIAQVDIKGIVLQNDVDAVKSELSKDTYMPYSESIYAEKSLNYYVGREYYVTEFGEHKGRTLTRKFLLTQDEYDKLKRLYKSFVTLTYRDELENMFSCVLESLQSENAILNTMLDVTVTIIQVDDSEEISIYD